MLEKHTSTHVRGPNKEKTGECRELATAEASKDVSSNHLNGLACGLNACCETSAHSVNPELSQDLGGESRDLDCGPDTEVSIAYFTTTMTLQAPTSKRYKAQIKQPQSPLISHSMHGSTKP